MKEIILYLEYLNNQEDKRVSVTNNRANQYYKGDPGSETKKGIECLPKNQNFLISFAT